MSSLLTSNIICKSVNFALLTHYLIMEVAWNPISLLCPLNAEKLTQSLKSPSFDESFGHVYWQSLMCPTCYRVSLMPMSSITLSTCTMQTSSSWLFSLVLWNPLGVRMSSFLHSLHQNLHFFDYRSSLFFCLSIQDSLRNNSPVTQYPYQTCIWCTINYSFPKSAPIIIHSTFPNFDYFSMR